MLYLINTLRAGHIINNNFLIIRIMEKMKVLIQNIYLK